MSRRELGAVLQVALCKAFVVTCLVLAAGHAQDHWWRALY